MNIVKNIARALIVTAVFIGSRIPVRADVSLPALMEISFENLTNEEVFITLPNREHNWIMKGMDNLFIDDQGKTLPFTVQTVRFEGENMIPTRTTTFNIAPRDKKFRITIDASNKLVVTKVG